MWVIANSFFDHQAVAKFQRGALTHNHYTGFLGLDFQNGRRDSRVPVIEFLADTVVAGHEQPGQDLVDSLGGGMGDDRCQLGRRAAVHDLQQHVWCFFVFANVKRAVGYAELLGFTGQTQS